MREPLVGIRSEDGPGNLQLMAGDGWKYLRVVCFRALIV